MPVAGYIRVKAGGFPIETLDAMGVPSLVPRSDALAETAKTIHYLRRDRHCRADRAACRGCRLSRHVRRDGVFSRMWPPFAGRGG
jgi:hypothetical protein